MEPSYTIIYHKYSMKYRRIMDRLMYYKARRWVFAVIVLLIYVFRIIQTQSYFVVTYVYAVHLIQMLLRYLTPLGLPDIEDEDEEIDIQLPNHSDDRPLLRSMSEIGLWEAFTWTSLVALLCTNFQVLDLPVYWPFLLSYFVMISVMTFKKYLKHMQKYGYSLSDFNKRRSDR